MPAFDTILSGGILVNHNGTGLGDIAIRDGCIAAMGNLSSADAGHRIDVKGLHILPGVIDSQVHFREPGLEHKEDFYTGARAAVKGGVTAIFEMPNTKPATTTAEALDDKVRRARDRMYCDFAFYAGATDQNIEDLPELERLPGCCGVKVFMGSSTGTLLVASDEGVGEILRVIRRRAAFHSEDEFRLRERRPEAKEGHVETHPVWRDAQSALSSTKRLLDLARTAGKRIHVLHVSTAEEMDLLARHRDIASVEVTPQHLTLAAPRCYEVLGTKAQMNPPIRDEAHRDGLWKGLAAGIVDVIGSDHAPHTDEEKSKPYPASSSGMPGVQTLVPLMLDHVSKGSLTVERFVDLTSHGVGRLFGLAGKGRMAVGYDADLTVVDLNATRTIEDDWLESKCGWSPFEGKVVKGWPVGTIVRGRTVMWEDEILGEPAGAPIRFQETL